MAETSGINRNRLVDELIDLIRIDSHSKSERRVADRIASDLKSLGVAVEMDDAAAKVGGECGNLIARIEGNSEGAPPLLLSAHMDTVAPGAGIKPIIEGDVIKSDGRTVLGGDDKSGVAIILEVVRVLKGSALPHGPIEIVFTVCEEAGLLGAKNFDASRLAARQGLVLDCDNVNFLFTRAPASDRMEFTIEGVEAHAGVCPERGISAIAVAAEAIAKMRLGRIDHQTTANIGTIEGGTATNVVAKRARFTAEARSRSEKKLKRITERMRKIVREAAAKRSVEIDGSVRNARVEEKVWRDYDPLNVPEGSEIVRLALEAARRLGYPLSTQATGGGCDANVFNKKGLLVANLGTGMHDIHTCNEWLSISQMLRAAQIVLGIVTLNAERG